MVELKIIVFFTSGPIHGFLFVLPKQDTLYISFLSNLFEEDTVTLIYAGKCKDFIAQSVFPYCP